MSDADSAEEGLEMLGGEGALQPGDRALTNLRTRQGSEKKRSQGEGCSPAAVEFQIAEKLRRTPCGQHLLLESIRPVCS